MHLIGDTHSWNQICTNYTDPPRDEVSWIAEEFLDVYKDVRVLRNHRLLNPSNKEMMGFYVRGFDAFDMMGHKIPFIKVVSDQYFDPVILNVGIFSRGLYHGNYFVWIEPNHGSVYSNPYAGFISYATL